MSKTNRDPAQALADELNVQRFTDRPGIQERPAKAAGIGPQPSEPPAATTPSEPENAPTANRGPTGGESAAQAKPTREEVDAVVAKLRKTGTGEVKLRAILEAHVLAVSLPDFMDRLHRDLPALTMEKLKKIIG